MSSTRQADGTCLLYIDRHLVHEVTSPQAFEGLRMAGRKVRAAGEDAGRRRPQRRRPRPTASHGIKDEESRIQVETLAKNAKDFGIEYYDERDVRQGIVHIIGPEQGFTLPGMTIVCGDSHTSTHGAFGALAHGIGTSEVEHVLATQTLIQRKAKNMRVTRRRQAAGRRHRQGHHPGHHRRDRHRRRHRLRHRICRRGDPRAVDGRPHDGLQHVDRGRRARRPGRARREDLRLSQGPAARRPRATAWDLAVEYWETLQSDEGAHFDREVEARRRQACRRSSPGAPRPEDVVSVDRRRARPRRRSPTRASAPRWSARSTIWA